MQGEKITPNKGLQKPVHCMLAVRAEGNAPCSCLGSADVHMNSNFGKHVFSFYAFFNNKTCTVSEPQPLTCGSL